MAGHEYHLLYLFLNQEWRFLNRFQKVILVIFLTITAVLLVLDRFLPGAVIVNTIKFTTVLALFFIAFIAKKRYPEQVFLTIAVFFVMMGDFLLNLCSIYPLLYQRVMVMGGIDFLVAYSLLIWVGKKNMRFGYREILSALPLIAVYVFTLGSLYSFIEKAMLIKVVPLSLVLFSMTWISLCTVFSNCYSPAVSSRMALSGVLILISDIAIANDFFNPNYAGQYVPWLKNIIWGAYVPAWTLVVLNITEDRMY